MMTHKTQKRKGFTLIELLVSILIMTFLGATIYHILSSGLRLWRQSTQVKIFEEVNFYLEIMTQDVRNAIRYSTKDFEGQPNVLTFYALQPHQTKSTDVAYRVEAPAKITYQFDPGNQTVVRKQEDFIQLLDEKNKATKEKLMISNIIRQKYEYYYADKYFSYEWRDHWKDTCFPRAIRLSVDYIERNKVQTIARVIPLTNNICVI